MTFTTEPRTPVFLSFLLVLEEGRSVLRRSSAATPSPSFSLYHAIASPVVDILPITAPVIVRFIMCCSSLMLSFIRLRYAFSHAMLHYVNIMYARAISVSRSLLVGPVAHWQQPYKLSS